MSYMIKIKVTIYAGEGGTTEPKPGEYEYNIPRERFATGITITIKAIPSSGYEFDKWLVNSTTNTTNPVTVTLRSDTTVTAYFKKAALPPPTPPPPTQPSPTPKVKLTIRTTEGGTTVPNPGVYEYNKGSITSIRAMHSYGYVFDKWLVNGTTDITNPITLTLNSDTTVTAYFKKESTTYTIRGINWVPSFNMPAYLSHVWVGDPKGVMYERHETFSENGKWSVTVWKDIGYVVTIDGGYYERIVVSNVYPSDESRQFNLKCNLGRVRFKVTGYTGTPLANILVDFVFNKYVTIPKTTSSDGTVIFGPFEPPVPHTGGESFVYFSPGTYKVIFNAGYSDPWYEAKAITVTVEADKTTDVTVPLTPRGGGVEGFVKDSKTGRPIEGAWVYVGEGITTCTMITDKKGYYCTPRDVGFIKPDVGVKVPGFGYLIASKTVDVVKGTFTRCDFDLLPDKSFLSIGIASGSGVTDPPPGFYEYEYGDVVFARALPSPGYEFEKWRVDTMYDSTDNPFMLTITKSGHGLGAYFKKAAPPPPAPTEKRTLTIRVEATNGASGTTEPKPGTYEYGKDSTVRVWAYPASGSILSSWTLDGTYQSAVNPISVKMDKNHTLVAWFKPGVAVPKLGAVAGKVKDALTGVSIEGATVTCDSLSTETEFGGNYAIYDVPIGPRTVKVSKAGYIDQSKDIIVEEKKTTFLDFNLQPVSPPPKVKVTIYAREGGTTEPKPGVYEYDKGSNVTIKAVPSSDYEFDKWLVDSTTNTTNPITLTLSSDTIVTAYFKKAALPPPTPPPPAQPAPAPNLLLYVAVGGLVATALTFIFTKRKSKK